MRTGISKSSKKTALKKYFIIPAGIIFIIILLSLENQKPSYVGAKECQLCHHSEKQGHQYKIWSESLHSKSFDNLKTDIAKMIAEKMALEQPPENSDRCLHCHAPLFDDSSEIKKEGVTCEACHGPGSVYKKAKIMKNPKQRI